MANKKISQLSVRTPSLTDLMLIGDPSTGFSYKATISAVSSVIESAIGGNYVTLATTQTISGAKTFSNTLTLSSVSNASTDTDKFVVLDGGVVKYRTGTQLLSDIGGVGGSGTSGYVPKFTGASSLGNSLIYSGTSTIDVAYSTQDSAFNVDAQNYVIQLGDFNGFNNSTYQVIDDTSGIIYFATNGVERARITSGGNVGIGTSSPIDKLHIVGGITSTSIANPSNTAIGSIQMGYDGTNGIIRTWNSSPILMSTYGYFVVQTYGSERLRITSGGNVGIGTSNPLTPLVVSANGYEGLEVTPVFNGVTYLTTYNRGGGAYNPMALEFSNLRFNPNGIEAMRLTSTGLGIGTTSPAYKLNVIGESGFQGASAGTDGIINLFRGSSTTYGARVRAFDSDGSVAFESVGDNANPKMYFRMRSDGTPVTAMTITGGGNVGIGNTSPSQKLTIGDGSGTGNQYIRMYSSASDIYLGQTSSNLFGAGNGQVLVADATYTSNFAIGTISPNESVNLIFGTNNLERMRIKANGIINLSNVPTSSAGLSSGDVYKTVAGVLMIV